MCEEDSSVGDFFTVSYTDGDRDPYKASSFSIVSWTPDGDVPGTYVCVLCVLYHETSTVRTLLGPH